MTDRVNLVEIVDVVRFAVDRTLSDTDLYDIKVGSRYQLRLLYHYTLRRIFELKQSNINTIFVVNRIDDVIITDKIRLKYIKFINSLQKLIPSMIIADNVGTHVCSNLVLILTNLSEKSTKKNKNLRALRSFCDKHGLTNILDEYLTDPNIQYILCT